MRFTALIGCAALLIGCTKKDEAPAVDTTAAAPAPAAAPAAPMSLATMAGKWHVNVKLADKDTVVTSYMLDTSDSTKWSLTFDKGGTGAVAMNITGRSGDTVMTSTDWFDSNVRKGMKVKTDSKTWMQDGKLMGSVVAHYKTTKPDSVLNLVTEGTKQ
jgi:hypothetical protein